MTRMNLFIEYNNGRLFTEQDVIKVWVDNKHKRFNYITRANQSLVISGILDKIKNVEINYIDEDIYEKRAKNIN